MGKVQRIDAIDVPSYIFPDLLGRVAVRIIYEQSPQQIHDFLIGQGLSEYQAWLTYVGAKMLAKDQMP